MKNLILLSAILLTATSVSATEPLLLEPLSPAVLSTIPSVTTPTAGNNGVQITIPANPGATITPISLNANMVPQNAAAEGKPVPQRRQPRVKIQTKQRSQSNSYWNAGGKGTKSFF